MRIPQWLRFRRRAATHQVRPEQVLDEDPVVREINTGRTQFWVRGEDGEIRKEQE